MKKQFLNISSLFQVPLFLLIFRPPSLSFDRNYSAQALLIKHAYEHNDALLI